MKHAEYFEKIRLLCKLNQTDAAEKRAEEWAERYPKDFGAPLSAALVAIDFGRADFLETFFDGRCERFRVRLSEALRLASRRERKSVEAAVAPYTSYMEELERAKDALLFLEETAPEEDGAAERKRRWDEAQKRAEAAASAAEEAKADVRRAEAAEAAAREELSSAQADDAAEKLERKGEPKGLFAASRRKKYFADLVLLRRQRETRISEAESALSARQEEAKAARRNAEEKERAAEEAEADRSALFALLEEEETAERERRETQKRERAAETERCLEILERFPDRERLKQKLAAERGRNRSD